MSAQRNSRGQRMMLPKEMSDVSANTEECCPLVEWGGGQLAEDSSARWRTGVSP